MDDGSPIRFILLFIILLAGSAYFAATEIAMASVNNFRMMSLADDGSKRARRVLYILNNFDKALTTLLIGNNVFHIGIATISTLMAAKYWGANSVTAATLITTAVVFLVAEMLPKCFAKANSERFALNVSGSLVLLMKLFTPFAFVFRKMSDFMSRPFLKNVKEEPTVTEDELYDIIETACEEGALETDRGELVQSALEFSETLVSDIYTPWEYVEKLSVTMDTETIVNAVRESCHSRFPVVDENGECIGVVLIRRYLKEYLKSGSGPKLRSVMEELHYVEHDAQIDDLLPEMSKGKTHLSLVLDGEGVTIGIVTVEDILEELVGEIYDEDDTALPEGEAESAGRDGHTA